MNHIRAWNINYNYLLFFEFSKSINHAHFVTIYHACGGHTACFKRLKVSIKKAKGLPTETVQI